MRSEEVYSEHPQITMSGRTWGHLGLWSHFRRHQEKGTSRSLVGQAFVRRSDQQEGGVQVLAGLLTGLKKTWPGSGA